tara:strand:- start:402 stop:608 length:207 start_codon:yes stop_codon:yes gene_type:complete
LKITKDGSIQPELSGSWLGLQEKLSYSLLEASGVLAFLAMAIMEEMAVLIAKNATEDPQYVNNRPHSN